MALTSACAIFEGESASGAPQWSCCDRSDQELWRFDVPGGMRWLDDSLEQALFLEPASGGEARAMLYDLPH